MAKCNQIALTTVLHLECTGAQIGKNKNKKDCMHEDLNSKETNLKEITLH